MNKSIRLLAVAAIFVLVGAGTARAEGAVAYGSDGRTGISYNYRSRGEAEDRARSECGRSCRIVGHFERQCAAIATARRGGYGWARRDRQGQADRAAVENCENEGNRGCSVESHGCDDR